MAQRVCVTGASGQAGRAVVDGLREHGYHVTPTDVVVSRADREDGMLQADLTDYGQAVEALTQPDAVVHLANIPAPGLSTPVMNRPSAELLAEVYPTVKLTRDVGEFGTLLAIDRAREVLGFAPAHSWRDHVTV